MTSMLEKRKELEDELKELEVKRRDTDMEIRNMIRDPRNRALLNSERRRQRNAVRQVIFPREKRQNTSRIQSVVHRIGGREAHEARGDDDLFGNLRKQQYNKNSSHKRRVITTRGGSQRIIATNTDADESEEEEEDQQSDNMRNDDNSKARLSSAVISNTHSKRPKPHQRDRKLFNRNKRIFGSLLGHLKKATRDIREERHTKEQKKKRKA